MQKFDGFTAGKHRHISLPAQFFDELLPLIDDLAELKVTLFCFQALHQKQGIYRYLTRADFDFAQELLQGLQTIQPENPVEEILTEALTQTVKRGTLLHAMVDIQGNSVGLYFLNTARGRRAISQIEAGQWHLDDTQTVEILPERPNIYTLYEENIGLLTPLIADELQDAEDTYPENWIADAIKLAVEGNKRNWRYIRAILKRWQQEGKDSHETSGRDTVEDGRDYATGKFADIIES